MSSRTSPHSSSFCSPEVTVKCLTQPLTLTLLSQGLPWAGPLTSFGKTGLFVTKEVSHRHLPALGPLPGPQVLGERFTLRRSLRAKMSGDRSGVPLLQCQERAQSLLCPPGSNMGSPCPACLGLVFQMAWLIPCPTPPKFTFTQRQTPRPSTNTHPDRPQILHGPTWTCSCDPDTDASASFHTQKTYMRERAPPFPPERNKNRNKSLFSVLWKS